VQQIEQEPDKKQTVKHKKILRDGHPAEHRTLCDEAVFSVRGVSLVDATIAPILWRLPYYEIDLPPQAQPIIKYASLVFARAAFRGQSVGRRAGDAPSVRLTRAVVN